MRLWVDEGHGGADSGAVGGGKKEDTRNLTLGTRVEALAKIQGWSVSSTRSKDVAAALSARYTKANAYNADVFVSIHHDWTKGQQAVIYPKNHDVASSRRLADVINNRIDPLAPTAGDIYADRRGLAVLKGTDMPAVIIEASRVQDSYDVAKMAEAIVRGICDYLKTPYHTTKPVVAPAPVKYMLTRVLAEKSSGSAVARLQRLLKIKDDGIFGPDTKKAVIAFQKKNHLKADGIVGKDTAKKLGWNFK